MSRTSKLWTVFGLSAALAVGSTVPAAAFHIWIGHHHHNYYDYYGHGYYGRGTYNGCPPHYTVQGGVCKPYRFGPWDRYW